MLNFVVAMIHTYIQTPLDFLASSMYALKSKFWYIYRNQGFTPAANAGQFLTEDDKDMNNSLLE